MKKYLVSIYNDKGDDTFSEFPFANYMLMASSEEAAIATAKTIFLEDFHFSVEEKSN